MAKPKQQVVVTKKPPIHPDVLDMMADLQRRFSPSQLQVRYVELLDLKLCVDVLKLNPAVRKLQIDACQEMGYKDLRKIKTFDED